MITLSARAGFSKNTFHAVANPFLQAHALPFSDVMDAQHVRQVFEEEGGLFGSGPGDIFSTDIVLSAYLAQTLRSGKEAACAAAVAGIVAHRVQTGQKPPSGNTGDYCRARDKLNIVALRRLTIGAAQQVEQEVPKAWLFKGLHAKLVDGFTVTMLDTPQNQAAFPQLHSQKKGVGFPIARAVVVMSLATACMHHLALGPYEGKETGETALLRTILNCFSPEDLVLFDRYYCSYMMIALLQARQVHVCTRLHQRRHSDFRRGKRLGPGDHLITWTRPERPEWMTPEEYATIPETMTLREIRFQVCEPGKRVETLTLITTLTDSTQFSKEDIAQLFGFRWNVELDIRQIKQTLGLDHVPCKSPERVLRHLWVTLLGYNLIRKLNVTAAVVHGCQARQLGFTLACQTVLASWGFLATGTCRDVQAMTQVVLKQIAANRVANRPGRIEPRVLKRRRHRYPLMRRSRKELKAKCA